MTTVELADSYLRFCEGVLRLCQVDLRHYRRGQMERRIRSFAERRGVRDLLDYLQLLREDGDELASFVDRLTINVSQLWRNPEQWDALVARTLPELAESGRIRAWSAGCSYGAEAYTLAALCREHAPRAGVEVVGWDLDRRMVERAVDGRFTADDARSAPPALLERWFERDGDGWRARPELRRACSFRVANLLTDPFPTAAYDLVMCRNTVIYFKDEVRDALHGRLAASLRPGGYLMVGATERVTSPARAGLEPARPFVYRKV